MYRHFCAHLGWAVEELSVSRSDQGGCREAIVSVEGDGVVGTLKYETGVHRVQRIPATEALGRVHTSTATVALLPRPRDVDVTIHERDLVVQTFRAGGAGGQHVNKTDSAVRITHVPTGVTVECQQERSQHRNRAMALLMLRARLFDAERERRARERSSARREQIGTGSRSERIRTYNFTQDRITDHRIGFTAHGVQAMFAGDTRVLASLIGALQARDAQLALDAAAHAWRQSTASLSLPSAPA